MSYLDRLSNELGERGIRGRQRQRIVAEFADHLNCDPDAELGEPGALATQFADELGTSLARRAALTSFCALAVAAIAIAVAFLAQADHGLVRQVGQAPSPSGGVGLGLMAIGAQVALVAGGLAALRAFRRRRAVTVPAAEAAILVRRAGVGIAAGAVSMAGLALTALVLDGRATGSAVTFAFAGAGAGALALAAAAPSVAAAARVRLSMEGPAGDLRDDVGPVFALGLRSHPWRYALLVATIVAGVIAGAGVVQSDPFDGALRALADGGACLIGFALLGRYLGLRAGDSAEPSRAGQADSS